MEKVSVTTEMVKQLVAEQFSQWSDLSVRPVKTCGWDNFTFHLGTDKLVRLPSAECYANQAIKEARWLPYLQKYLSLTIPRPLALGKPSTKYPFHWAVVEWIEGITLAEASSAETNKVAYELADFLNELHQIPVEDGPSPSHENFYRGGDLSVYDIEARKAISDLPDQWDRDKLNEIWQLALNSQQPSSTVWVHGDLSASNILVNNEGRLVSVIDFGLMCVGDAACDLVPAWTYFEGKSRELFMRRIIASEAMWHRARGWALWKAAINVERSNESEGLNASSVLAELLKSLKKGFSC